ncbi:MAG: hypothetical protein U5J78_04170 [Parasphingorhabdus sp.]|nr:hypothetical protein [Parasphingorhabdus sp.]
MALWDAKMVHRKAAAISYLHSALGGALWGGSFLILGGTGNSTVLLSHWAAVLCLMVGSAMLLSAIPLGSILFIVFAGAGATAALFLESDLNLALSAMVVTSLLTGSCLSSARRFIESKVAEANLVEKNEVVSLLLREFEDTGADWLWQTDTARRPSPCYQPRLALCAGTGLPKRSEGKPFLQMVAGESWEHGQVCRPPCTIWPSV